MSSIYRYIRTSVFRNSVTNEYSLCMNACMHVLSHFNRIVSESALCQYLYFVPPKCSKVRVRVFQVFHRLCTYQNAWGVFLFYVFLYTLQSYGVYLVQCILLFCNKSRHDSLSYIFLRVTRYVFVGEFNLLRNNVCGGTEETSILLENLT